MASTFIEFHILRSHAPGNMNRDDLGTPKTALFGGHRRLRISSQCLKRTWRKSDYFVSSLEGEPLGQRTKKLAAVTASALATDGIDAETLKGLDLLIAKIGKGSDKKGSNDEREEENGTESDGKTSHLLYLSPDEISTFREFVRENATGLKALVSAPETVVAPEPTEASAETQPDAASPAVAKAKGGKRQKQRSSARAKQTEQAEAADGPEEADDADKTDSAGKAMNVLRKKLIQHMKKATPRLAVDIALFGRFLTSGEFETVNASLQVAHALGTQKVELEYDYYSAVPDDGEGPSAEHIGETEFAASVLYEYAVCNYNDLVANIGRNQVVSDLVKHRNAAHKALRAVLNAAARAVPKGKVNGTAPQNPADYIEVVVRTDAPISLANAFLKPVSPTTADDVMKLSVKRLGEFRDRYEQAYSEPESVLARLVLNLDDLPREKVPEGPLRCGSLKALSERLDTVLKATTLPPTTPS